jgi:hypothetical protein
VLLRFPPNYRYLSTNEQLPSIFLKIHLINDEIFRLGGMILGWIGAIESLVVVILTTIGLTHVPEIMDHLRNETRMPSLKMEAINETHVSLFRRHRGEMTTEDEMFIERGK